MYPEPVNMIKYKIFIAYLFVTCKFIQAQEINPDTELNTPQIIRRHGYTAESHTVETEDGYLLTIHRIPINRNGERGNQPILLQHGLLSSSADWLDRGDTSLAFYLSDNGYDIWLGNARGNMYSTGHSNMSVHTDEFWNFSWHEMGIYDLPAVISHITSATGKGGEILYVGHSMGTTMFFVFASLRPEIAKNVQAMVALAPVAYMTHLTSPLRYLAPFSHDVQFIVKHLGIRQFLPSNKILRLLEYECLFSFEKYICENLVFAMFGFDKSQMDADMLPVIVSHAPAGTSTKTVLHYFQEIANNGEFQYFDYGTYENMQRYGQPTPLKYKLKNIRVPVYLMYADSDVLANPVDVRRIAGNFSSLIGTYEVPLKQFNHIDFLFARDAPQLVYEPMLNVLRNSSLFNRV